MLSYKNRFHGYNALRYVYKNSHASRTQYFDLRYIKNPRRKHSRVAVVVSKKIYKSAVGRNRIRRRLYELFRQILPEFNDVYDFVCIVKSSELRDMENEKLTKLFIAELHKAGITRSQEK